MFDGRRKEEENQSLQTAIKTHSQRFIHTIWPHCYCIAVMEDGGGGETKCAEIVFFYMDNRDESGLKKCISMSK